MDSLHFSFLYSFYSFSLSTIFSFNVNNKVGPNAKRRFFRKFHQEWKQQLKTQQPVHKSRSTTDLLLGSTQKELLLGTTTRVPATKQLMPLILTTLGSARGKFLARCASEELPPHPALIRKFKSKELNLQGLLIGDDLGLCLAEALPSIPHLEELDLSSNRMTGISIGRALNAIELTDTLFSINLSDNKLGKQGMKGLISFLSKTSCLETLELERTRSGDAEAKLLCEGLCFNKTVTFLNVANNDFGEKSGLYFARVLRRLPSTEDSCQCEDGSMRIVSSESCLTNLDLSWNQIRKTGAAAMGKAFLYNDKLATLDLSYCAFGDEGTSVIMNSLRTNTSLTWLELDNNAIKGRGSMVAAYCLEQNLTLKYLQLWENPIGKSGGRSFLRSVSRSGDIREMQLDKCNFEIEEDGMFDPEHPPMSLHLNLDILYDRAVATEFFRVIQHRPGISVKVMTLDDRPISFEQYQEEELEGWNSDDEEQEDDDDGDSDDSDDDDNDNNTDSSTNTTRTRSNSIKIEELFFRVNGKAYEVPSTGILNIECDHLPRKPPKTAAVSNEGLKGLISIIFGQEESTIRDILLRLKTAMCDAYVTARQARKIIQQFENTRDRREATEIILPRLINPKQKFLVLQQNLQPKDIEALEKRMGAMFYFTPHNPTGHYELNLENAHDRKVAQALCHQNNEDVRWAEEKSDRGDTSQSGNWSSIRNALHRNKEIIIDSTWNVIPKDGLLELDYVSCRKGEKKHRRLIMTSSKFKTFCEDLGLKQGGSEFDYKPGFSWALAASMLSLMRARRNLTDLKGKALQKEACSRIQRWYRNKVRDKKKQVASMDCKLKAPTEEEIIEDAANKLQNWYLKLCRKWCFDSGLPPSVTVRQSLLSNSGVGYGNGILGLIRKALAQQKVLDVRKSRRVVENGLMPLRRRISKRWLTCKQVASIMSCFEPMYPKYCRVRVLQICFSRIIDLENFFLHIMNHVLPNGKRLLHRLKADECNGVVDGGPGKITRVKMFQTDYEEVIKRIGWLNIFNPNDPDLIFDIDHSRYDHYQLVLMLIELADVEPGENFIDETFTKWDKQSVDPKTGEKGAFVMISGWELPLSWLDPGPPEIGHLHVEYYSGRDSSQLIDKDDPRGSLAGLEGCAPIWELRASMLQKVLLGNCK